MIFILILAYALSFSFSTPLRPSKLIATEKDVSFTLMEQAIDPCEHIYSNPNGLDRYDCTHVTSLSKDGHCPVGKDDGDSCMKYCEVRRTAFYGEEVEIPGTNEIENKFPPGQKAQLQSGIELSVESSFGIGATAGVPNGVFSAGVSFAYTVGVTTTKTIAIEEEPSDEFESSWVAFPIFITTCGTATQVDGKFKAGGRDTPLTRECTGQNPRSTPNVCATVPHMIGPKNGKSTPGVQYALRESAIELIVNVLIRA